MLSTLALLFRHLLREKWKVVVYILLSLLILSASLATPYLTGNFLDQILASPNYEYLYKYSILVGGIFLLKTILNYASNMLFLHLQLHIGYQFNIDIIRHIQKADFLIANNMQASYLSQQINTDTTELIIFALSFAPSLITNSLIFLIPIVVLIRINANIAYLIIAASVLYIGKRLIFRRR